MAWTWKTSVLVLVLALLYFITRTRSECVYQGGYHTGDGDHYMCSNMTRDQYQTDIVNVISYKTVRKLDMIQLNLATIDQRLFSNNDYREVYNLKIKQCGVTTIENHSFDVFTQLDYLYILGNNIKHFNGHFIKPLVDLNLLDVSDNNIQQFTIDCNNIQQFTMLALDNNALTNLTKSSFNNCGYLQLIEIRNSSLGELRESTFEGLRSLIRLDLKNTNILKMYSGAFKGLNDVSINELTCTLEDVILKGETFLGLNNLKNNLTIISNNIEIIEPGSFHNLNTIKSMKINFRKLYKIKKDQFIGLNSLRYLDLSDMNMNSITPGAFNGLNNLVELNLNGNNITHLSSNIFYETYNLRNVSLNLNNVEDIEPGAFIGLSSVEQLNMKFIFQQINNIKKNQFTGFSSLRSIDLSNMKIKSIAPGAFNGLNNLVELNLNGNNITHLSSNIFNETYNLLNVSLNLNNVEDIEPGAFIGLSVVVNLNLKYIFQNINTIRRGQFNGLSSLLTLDLSNLKIHTIESEAFTGLQKVQTILLQNNNISSSISSLFFSCDVFNQNNVIKVLNLSNNQIENISICAFQNLILLNTLHLQFNRISYLKVGTLSALGQLRHLDLSHNRLSALSEPVLHPLERIEVLDISANYFTHLNPEPLFSHLKTLNQIDLSGNQWSCQNLTLIRKYFRSRGIGYESKILNYTMENIAGIQCVDEQIKDNIIHSNVESGLNINESVSKSEIILNNNSINFRQLLEILINNTADFRQINKVSELQLNTMNHTYNLFIIICISFACYKIICLTFRTYQKFATKSSLQKYESRRTELELLHTVADSL